MASASLAIPAFPTLPATAEAPLLPASAHRVYTLLRERGPLTHKDLLRESGLPGRTVRWAVTRLKEEGLVRSRHNLRDSRQSLHYPAAPTPATPSTLGPFQAQG